MMLRKELAILGSSSKGKYSYKSVKIKSKERRKRKDYLGYSDSEAIEAVELSTRKYSL